MKYSQNTIIESPIGNLRITGNDDSIFEVRFWESDEIIQNTPPKEVQKCAIQLKEYFANERITFDLNLKPVGTAFQKSVWRALLKIPFGTTSTYARQAYQLGNPKAIRAIATANSKNPIPIIIPCHRIIGSDGNLRGYAGGLDKKEWLLRHEGVITSKQIEMSFT